MRAIERQNKNILVIVLDDLGTDKLAFYGETPPSCPPQTCDLPPNCPAAQSGCVAPYPATPNLDEIKEQGILFRKCYATPVCSSTRAWIQTGRYGFRTGIGTITSTVQIPGYYSLPNSEKTLAELLRQGFQPRVKTLGQPYRCGAFGKWHLATSFEADYGHAVANGYNHFAGTVGNVSSFYRFDKVEHTAGSAPVVKSLDGRFTSPPFTVETWHASETRRDALHWINAQTNSFLAYVAFGPPHTPLQVPPLELLPPSTVCELTCAGLTAGNIVIQSVDPAEQLRLVLRAQIEAVDAELGKLIHGIDPEKLANTMILIMGDNGTASFVVDQPPHVAWHGKGEVYELGIRVPFLVSGPLVKKPVPIGGWESDALVSAVDLFRTIADITGADASRVVPLNELDSISFLPVIRDPLSAGNRTTVFSQTFSPLGIIGTPPPSCYTPYHQRSLSDGTYKYHRRQTSLSTKPCGTPTYLEELYHLPSDPEEVSELILAGGMSQEAVDALASLSAEMDALSGL